MSEFEFPPIDPPDIWDFIPYTVPWWRSTIDWIQSYPAIMYGRVNTVVASFQWTCGDNLWVYLQLALPALGELFLQLFAIEYDDILRGFLRGPGLRSRAKFFGGKNKSKWSLELPEWGEEIGKRIPLAGKVKGTPLGGALRWLFRIDAAIQRTLFYFVAVDMISEFVFNWSSSVIRSQQCADGGVFIRNAGYGFNAAPGPKQVPIFTTIAEEYVGGSIDGSVYVDGDGIMCLRPASLLASVSVEPIFPISGSCRYSLRWREASTGREWLANVGDSRRSDLNSSTFVWSNADPGRYELFMDVTDSTLASGIMRVNVISAK